MPDRTSLPSFPNAEHSNEVGLRTERAKDRSSLPLIALILGIFGGGGLIGIVVAIVALGRARRNEWMAVTGLVLSALWLVAYVVVLVVLSP